MAESWTQNINKEIPWETSSNNNNLQIHNWGDRPSAPSENNWGAKKTVQEPWGPNKSENWASRNNIVEVDQSSWKNDEAISVSTYKQVNRHDEEEKLDSLAIQVSIEHSYESFKNVKEHQEIELDEDQYDPSYESVSSTSKSQLGKIATPFEDVTKYNISNRAEPLTTSSNSAFQEFQESHKVFRNVEVQTDTFDLSVIIASGEKLLSIGSQIKTVQDNIVSEKKNLPQQMSLLDMDWKTVENDSWNTTLSGDFREGTTVIPPTKPDISSHSEVTQFPWNSASRQASARSDNQDQQISVSDNQDAVSQQKPIQQKVLAQENAWGGMIPVEPDDWGTVQKTPVKEDTWTTQQKPIQQKAPAQENAWGTAPQQKQQKPLQEKAPAQENIMKPVHPDDWGTVQKSPATGETWPSQKGVISQPVQNNGWNPGSQKPLQSRPKDTVSQETSKESNENWGAASKPGDAWNKEPQNTGNTWDANNPPSTNDWIKKADLFAKELGESNQMKAAQSEGRKAKDSYNVGTNDSYNDTWNSNPSTGDWTKKADLYAKELGESNAAQSEDKKVKDSYNVGTNDSYYDNSSTNNRYGSRRCNTCGSEDHVARECPNKKCFKCGKEGHIGRECPESGAYGGYSGGRSCHKCGKEGHLARDCSESGGGAYGGGYGDICFKCNKPGHRSQDCKEDAHEITGEDGSYGSKSGSYTNGPPRNRMKSASPFSNPEPSDISSEEAWEKLLIADTKKDVDDFKDALELYAKATPGETFQTIEKKLRSANCNGRIIALERDEIPLTKVLVDLQGNRDKKYVASAIIGDPSRLAKTAGNRACSEEENFVWLANSGFMVDDTTPICFNCKQKGHITKDCQEPKKEIERPAILACQHCKSPEHMTKMCPERRDYYEEARDRRFAGGYRGENTARDEDRASSGYDDDSRKNSRYTSNQPCRNCNREGHLSRECPEPRRSGGVRRCHNCGKEGHISKDCTGSSGGDYDKGNYDSGSGWQRRSHSNKAASWGEHKDSPNQTRSVGPQETQWEKYGSDDPITSSRDDSTRDTNNTRDSTWITQNKGGDLTQQKDKSASILPVEKDDWNSQPETTTTQNDWGKGNKTGEDFGWKIPVSGNHENRQSQSEGYENSRGRGGNESNEGFENKRSRGNNYGSNEDRRRGNNYEYGEDRRRGNNYESNEDRRRGNNYESNEDRRRNYESNDDRRRGNYGSNEGFDNRRGRGNYESNEDRRRGNNYEYEDRRRGNNYEHNEDRRRGNNYESNEDRRRGNNYESNEDRRRGNNYESNRRGNYGSNEGFDNRRGRGNYESNEDKRGRGNYGNYDSNDSFENRRGRGNFSESNDGYENSRGRNDGPNDRNARSTQSSNANVAPLNEEAWW